MVFAGMYLIVVCAGVCTWLLLAALVPRLRNRLLDLPNNRSSHCQPTPRGGGISFVFVASVASAFAYLLRAGFSSMPVVLIASPLIVLPLALVGLLDDFIGLPASWRYCVQLLTAFVITLASPLVAPSFVLLPLLLTLVIVVTAVINFINFMDGLDGLVAGSTAVALTAAAIQLEAPWPIWALVGSLIGFLFWNWSPARVFMGDVGSTFLGAVFILLVLQTSSWFEAFALLMVLSPLLFDACVCVPRRLIAGQRVFQAHRLHLFQRLHQAGWSHSCVSSLYIAATTFLAFASLLGGLPWVIGIAVIELLIGIWLDQKVAVPFLVASNS